MKKSGFVTLVLGTVSLLLFALGMCMAMIEAWNAFRPGIVFSVIGVVLGLVTFLINRKMNHKAPIHVSLKMLGTIVVCVVGVLLLGVGMCFCMIWENMILGIVLGVIGIVVLLFMIPLTKGLQD